MNYFTAVSRKKVVDSHAGNFPLVIVEPSDLSGQLLIKKGKNGPSPNGLFMGSVNRAFR